MSTLLRQLSRSALSGGWWSRRNPLTLTRQPCRGLKAHRLELGPERHIMYKLIPGQQQLTIVYVPGLHSYAHMNGFMAQCLLRSVRVSNLPWGQECNILYISDTATSTNMAAWLMITNVSATPKERSGMSFSVIGKSINRSIITKHAVVQGFQSCGESPTNGMKWDNERVRNCTVYVIWFIYFEK